MRRLLLAAFILTITATACKKQDEGFTRALVLNSGDIATNGCGYLLRLENGQMIKPEQLSSAYQHDSLGVLIKFSETGRQSNCIPQEPIDIISITEIKRDL